MKENSKNYDRIFEEKAVQLSYERHDWICKQKLGKKRM